jgi:hypothetical protein
MKIFPPFAFSWLLPYAHGAGFMPKICLENLSTFSKSWIFCAMKIFPPFILGPYFVSTLP